MRPWFLADSDHATRASGDRWRDDCWRCDSQRGLSFTPLDHLGRWWLGTFRGCRPGDVLAIRGFTFDDLLYEAERSRRSPRATSSTSSTAPTAPAPRGGNTPAAQTSAHAHVQVDDGREPLVQELLRLWRERKVEPVPVALGRMPDHATPAMRHIGRELELRFGLLVAEGVVGPLMYATCEPVKAGIVTTNSGASYALRRLEDDGVIVCIGEGRRRGKPNGAKLFVPPGWRPVDPDALRRAQERGDGAALERSVWIPADASDGVPAPGGEAGAVPVEREDVVAGVPLDPLVEAPDEAGVADAVPGGGGLRGVRASVGAAGGGGAIHGSEDAAAAGRQQGLTS